MEITRAQVPHMNGLQGVAFFAVLENEPLDFIPYLREGATRGGGTDTEYLDVHGPADIEHAEEFSRAIVSEAVLDRGPLKDHHIHFGLGLGHTVIQEVFAAYKHVKKQ